MIMIRKILTTLFVAMVATMSAMAADKCAFAGGDAALTKWLADNIKYPAVCIDNAIEGTVTVTFTVKADGTITGAKISRPLDPDLESEALRLVSIMPAWTPATGADGTPISSQATLPITFNLPD